MASDAKVAVVTGSSSGIGLATALELARKGYFTYATVRNPAKGGALTEAAKGLPIALVQLDVTDDYSVRRAVEQMGRAPGR